jgi:hypothetical protein
MGKHAVSIWFFIGIILVIYGVLIFGAGIYGLSHEPAQPVVMWDLHAGIWWGILMLVMGGLYCWKFHPRSEEPDGKK